MKTFPNDNIENIPLTGLSMASESVGSHKVNCYQTEKGFNVEENEDFSILDQSDAIPIDACHSRKVKGFKYSVGEIIESKQEQWNSDNIVEDLDGADLGLIDFRNTDTDLAAPKCTRQSSVINLKEEKRKKQPKVWFENIVADNFTQENDKIPHETPKGLSKEKLHHTQAIANDDLQSCEQPQVQNEEICIEKPSGLNKEYLPNLAISQIKGGFIRQETGHNDRVLINNHQIPNEVDFVNLKLKSVKEPREKEREIGKGAFGKCFQVEFPLENGGAVNLAIKEIESIRKNNQEEEEMRKEFQILRRLDHPNIVRCFLDYLDNGQGKYCIAMEYMSGGTVSHFVHQNTRKMTDDRIKYYLVQILDGLAYLHSLNILHRDLKGENLLLSQDSYDLKICDFGCATEVQDIVNGYKDKQLVGTVPFMSPEVIRDHLYSAASDVWGVGCCIIQMATGKLPWDASGYKNEEMTLIYKIGIAENPPPIPAHLSPSLYDLTKSCLQIDKKRRPQVKNLLINKIFDDF